MPLPAQAADPVLPALAQHNRRPERSADILTYTRSTTEWQSMYHRPISITTQNTPIPVDNLHIIMLFAQSSAWVDFPVPEGAVKTIPSPRYVI